MRWNGPFLANRKNIASPGPHPRFFATGEPPLRRFHLDREVRNERLQHLVERCLESEAAYKLFDMLGKISQLELDARLKYLDLVRDSGVYTQEEVYAIERLILSGAAHYFKQAIDQRRDEHIRGEIAEMVG